MSSIYTHTYICIYIYIVYKGLLDAQVMPLPAESAICWEPLVLVMALEGNIINLLLLPVTIIINLLLL